MLNDWYENRLDEAVSNFEKYIEKAHEPVHVLGGMYHLIETVYATTISEFATDEFKKHARAVEHAAKYITRVAVKLADDFDGNQEELIKNFRISIVEYEEFMR